MYLSIWISIVMSTSQSGCSVLSKVSDKPEMAQALKALPVDGTQAGIGAPVVGGIINKDSPVPKVPPPGVRTRYSSIHTDQMVLAMTFDDGPHPQNTPKLLDLLKERNIKATFFLVGANVKAYPDIVRRIIAEGHEVANHTWTHPSLTSLSDEKIRSEMQRTQDAIVAASGYHPRLMRAPFGATNKRIEQWIFNEFGFPSILWSVDPNDWKRPGVAVVTRRLVEGAHKGAILLAHDIHAPTITAMPSTLDQLLAKGYQFVTVSQLLNIEKAAMPVGVVMPTEEPAKLPGKKKSAPSIN
jgi:peptidoglycan/xylan/chitin deacetylase (PgdA/CDA1 family)